MKPKIALQVMQAVFGLQPGTIVTIPEIASYLQLDLNDHLDSVHEVVKGFLDSDILAEIFPNCFVTETMAGGNPFLLVYSNILEDLYVCNIAGLPHKHFEELAKDPEYKSFYLDEPWSNELKAYLGNQSAKPCVRISYGKPTPAVEGRPEHEFGGYLYTGKEVHLVDNDYNVSRRRLTVIDLFNGSMQGYRAMFATQAEALEYAAYYTNPDRAPKKRRQSHNAGGGMSMMSASDTCGSSPTPADQKRFSLNEIHKMWETVPGFDASPYALKLKDHFMDNVLAKFL